MTRNGRGDEAAVAGPDVVSLHELDGSPRARLFEGEPKTVRLSLPAGEAIAEHRHPGRRIVLTVLDGELTLTLDGESTTLTAGDVARFDGERRIAPRAETDCRALIVLAEGD